MAGWQGRWHPLCIYASFVSSQGRVHQSLNSFSDTETKAGHAEAYTYLVLEILDDLDSRCGVQLKRTYFMYTRGRYE